MEAESELKLLPCGTFMMRRLIIFIPVRAHQPGGGDSNDWPPHGTHMHTHTHTHTHTEDRIGLHTTSGKTFHSKKLKKLKEGTNVFYFLLSF